MIRIVIADDHPLVREGFRALIERETDMTIAAECASAADAGLAVAETEPDVLVLDLMMRGGGGIEALPTLIARFPELRILILSRYGSEPYISEALGRGALGYVSKDVAPEELIAGIRTVAAGQRYLSTDLVVELPAGASRGLVRLSTRELEIFLLLAGGATPKQVAAALGISVKTAYVHRANVLAKLGARNDRELYRIALEHGLLGESA